MADFGIKEVPCVSCQQGYAGEHACDISDYCPCDRAENHMTADHPTREERYAALERLADQAWHTAGDTEGRERVHEDRTILHAALVAADREGEAGLSDGQSVQIVQCVGRIQRGEEPVDALLTIMERILAARGTKPAPAPLDHDDVMWMMPREAARDLLKWLRKNRPVGMPDDVFDGLTSAILAARAAQPVPAPGKCVDCGHKFPHDERWGCMAEVGEGGSGSVSDAVFCKCKRVPASEVSRGVAEESPEEMWRRASSWVAEVKAEALREFAATIAPDDHYCFRPQGCVDCGQQKARQAFRSNLIDRADRLVRDALGGERGDGA